MSGAKPKVLSAKALRKYLEAQQLSQRELAELLDVAERTVRRWVSGSIPVPRAIDYALRYLALQSSA
jgi:transcriptional regulator with XRE-family HTH domain